MEGMPNTPAILLGAGSAIQYNFILTSEMEEGLTLNVVT